WIEINWNPAIDEDGDVISYDVYLNDIAIFKDYIIGSNAYQGNVYYNQNFEEYLNEDIVIKVVGNDRSGGVTEISETFDFRGSDVDLGTLSLPYEEILDLTINETEPDNKIRYSFVVEETMGFTFISDIYGQMTLKDDQGNYISGNSTTLKGESLIPGAYYLEVRSYSDAEYSGTITLGLRNSKATDVNLGNLSVPYDQVSDYTISNIEPDSKIGYAFQITQETGFSVFSSNDISFNLINSSGNYISSGYRRAYFESLPVGEYYLEISQYYYSSSSSGTFNLVLDDPKSSDVNLGVLSLPYEDSRGFTLSNKEPDNKIAYFFEINSETGYAFSTLANTYVNLYNESGSYINGGYRSISGGTLIPGNYYVEISANSNYVDLSGTLSITLKDAKLSDVDLGALTAPFNQSYAFDTSNEIDRAIGYEFSVASETDYTFQIVSANYDEFIYLYDSSGNLINSRDYGAITGSLTAGSYYLVAGGYGNYASGTGTLSIDLQ
ncbi:MAG: hypothetical protein AAF901_14560, partial [Bacteroidota bacterium]